MKITPLTIDGAWEITPVLHGDPRGVFLEWFKDETFVAEIGHPFKLAQANIAVSAPGVVRGVHFADVPPGQAKYVTCVRGALLDVIVDLRVGSPQFGRWEAVRLDDVDRRAVYLSEGLGHGYCALTEGTTISYLCSEPYAPAHEFTVHPLDPELGIDWSVAEPQLSERDTAAPSLAEARANGLLPDYATCRAYTASLRS